MSVALDLFTAPPAGPTRPAITPPRLRLVPPQADRSATGGASRGEALIAPAVAYLRPPAGRESVAPVRLTRRGVVVLALLVAAAGGVLVWLAALSAPDAVAAPRVPASVAVRSGDTLWSIASRYAGDRDPRAVVAAIQQRNHLEDVSLVPGQVLRLR